MKRHYIHKVILYSVLCMLYLASCSACKNEPGNEEPPPEKPQSGYVDKLIHGFIVKVAAKDEKFLITQMTLERMKSDLELIAQLFLATQLDVMRENPIWAEVAIEPVEAARYHPNKQWLIDNGYDPDKAKCVEIANMQNYLDWTSKNQPYMVLHELSHLYHDQALTGGFNNSRVLTAYNAAVASRKYETVRYFNGTDTVNNARAYAINNQMEYFAELSEAYFGNNDFQPFDYEELKTFDPTGFALMVEIWGSRE